MDEKLMVGCLRCSKPFLEKPQYYVCVECAKYFLGPEYVNLWEMEIKLPVAEGQMIPLKDKTITKLIKLGILDVDLNITPNAIMPNVLRLPLREQCEMLGIRLIYRRPTSKKADVEKQMCTYLVNRYGGFADASVSGECYWIKGMFSALVEGFDFKKKRIQLTDKELKKKCAKISSIYDALIVYWYEQHLYDNIEFCGEITDISKSTLDARYKASKSKEPLWEESIEAKKERLGWWKGHRKSYIHNVMKMIALWHSLTPDTWSKLAWTVLSDWNNMYSGWPDINHVDKHGQLRLFEIKKHGDKLHTHQIYVLQKLLTVLGEDRIAVIEVGGGHWDMFYKPHFQETDKWLSKKI